jgi:hypothetical protein
MAEAAAEGAVVPPAVPGRTAGSRRPEGLFDDVQPSKPDVPSSLAPAPELATPSLVAEELESLRRQIADRDLLLRNARRLGQALQVELNEFRAQASESYARVQALVRSENKARTDLRLEKQKSQRLEKQLRSAKSMTDQEGNAGALFLDPVDQFTYEVEVAYAHRIPAADKAARPRRELRVGHSFLATLSSLEGVDRSKVVDVTVEIITDLVNELDSRDLHPLREGKGASTRDVVRQPDGAQCMRVALQRGTPSARRLHYWRMDEAIELSRVVKHDDMTP